MDLAQNVMRVLQSLEETQKAVAALSLRRVITTTTQQEDHARWILGVGEPSGGWIASNETRRGGNWEGHGGQWVEMPVFTGENPDGWIFRANRYFATYRLTEEEKLVVATMNLDGDALSWYQWTDSREAFGSWENLKKRLLLHFRPTQEGSLCEKFLAVRQRGSMAAYRREFEILATPLKGISEEVMESTFMNGLLPEIRVELRPLQPYGLGHLMEMAQRVEGRNLAMRAAHEPNGPKSTKMLPSANRGDWKIGENFQTRAVAVGEKTMS